MNPIPFHAAPPPPPPLLEPMQFPVLPPEPPNSSSFWESRNVCGRFRELQDTLNLVKGMYVVLISSKILLFSSETWILLKCYLIV